MNPTVLLYWFTLVVYLNARNITNEELAIVVHRLVGDVGILKQVARDQATILHRQDQTITAVQSSVNLFTQVTALLQKTVSGLDGKLGEQMSDIKKMKKSIDDIKSASLENNKSIASVKSEVKKSIDDVKSENNKSIASVKSEVEQSIDDVKSEIKQSIDDVKSASLENNKSIASVKSAMKHVEHTQADVDRKVKTNEREIAATKSKLQDAESRIQDVKDNQEEAIQSYFPKYRLRFVGMGWYKSEDGVYSYPSASSLTNCIELCYRKRQESSKWNGVSYKPEIKRCKCYAHDQGHQGDGDVPYSHSMWLHYRFE